MNFDWLEERFGDPICKHGGRKDADNGEFLDFSANVNPYAPDPNVLKIAKRLVASKDFYVGYPDSSYAKARNALASYVGNGVRESNVILSNGTIELIKLFCEVFTRGNAAVAIPTFCEYERFSRINGANMKFIQRSDKFENDTVNAICDNLGKDFGTFFICNPNNPTGRLIRRDTMIEVAQMLEDKGVMLFVDEAFIDFAPEESIIGDVQDHRNIVVGRSLTKILGIPGIRLGYGVAHEDTISYIKKAQMPWSVNNLAKGIAEEISKFRNFMSSSVRKLEIEREFLIRGLSNIDGIHIGPSNTNYLFLHMDGNTSSKIAKDMRDRGILIRKCDSFRGCDDSCIRIAVRDRAENERLVESFMALYE